MLSSFFLAMLLASTAAQEKAAVNEEETSYQLLYSSASRPGRSSGVGYAVSVNRFLDRPQIEKLICRVLLNEKAGPSSILAVSIYYKLDKFDPAYDFFGQAKLLDHMLADYIWNASLPGVRKRLTVLRNVQGDRLDPPQGHEFDHTKACDQLKR